jgi:hypothetical protein
MALSITTLCCYAEYQCAEFRDLFILMLNVIMLSVVMPSFIMLCGIMLSGIMLSGITLCHYAERHCAVCHNADCYYDECHGAKKCASLFQNKQILNRSCKCNLRELVLLPGCQTIKSFSLNGRESNVNRSLDGSIYPG